MGLPGHGLALMRMPVHGCDLTSFASSPGLSEVGSGFPSPDWIVLTDWAASPCFTTAERDAADFRADWRAALRSPDALTEHLVIRPGQFWRLSSALDCWLAARSSFTTLNDPLASGWRVLAISKPTFIEIHTTPRARFAILIT